MKHRTISAVLLALLALPAAALGRTATLVRDINTTPGPDPDPFRSSSPNLLGALGNKALFVATERGSGEELWVSDGTASGTQMLQDFCPGSCGSVYHWLGTVNGIALGLVSYSDGGENRIVLWRSDGTRTGTFLMLPPEYEVQWPGEGGSFALLGSTFYFPACLPDSGCELWRTDGTLAGTRILHRQMASSSLAVAGKKIFFATYTGEWQLWKTDGTAAGTTAVASLGAAPSEITGAGDKVFFLLGSVDGTEVWRSDGTKAGTRAVTQFENPDPFEHTFPYDPPRLRAFGNRVYFVANDVLHGHEIWRSDGGPAQRVTDFGYYTAVSYAYPMEEAGGRLVFQGTDGLTSLRFWTTDGRPESTAPLQQLCPGGCSFSRTNDTLLRANGRAFFIAQDEAHGTELWSTDGTGAGTRVVRDLCPGPCSSFITFSSASPGEVFFTAKDNLGPGPLQLWRSNGTEQGTRRVADLPSRVAGLVIAGSKVFYTGSNSYGAELWVAEGGQAHIVTDIARSEPSSSPKTLTAVGGQLVFTACDGSLRGLWSTSGSSESTLKVLENLRSCTFGDSEEPLPWRWVVGGRLVFMFFGDGQIWGLEGGKIVPLPLLEEGKSASTGAVLQERLFFFVYGGGQASLWSTDGTPAGTAEVLPLSGLSTATLPQAVGSEIYFTGYDPLPGLWRTDGTAAGTRKVSEIPPDSELIRVGSSLFFAHNESLWKTDGTAAGTTLVMDNLFSSPTEMTEMEGYLYFFLPGFEDSFLWRSDGTEAGTTWIASFSTADRTRSSSFSLTSFQGRLYFAADDGLHGTELWTSDGTETGTRMVRDLLPGVRGSHPTGLKVAAGKLYFTATDGIHGSELWESDGTAAGTRMIQDLAPQGVSSHPDQLTIVGDRLYFVANDSAVGRELWSLPLTGPAGCQPSATALCLGGRFRVEVRWRDFQGKAGAGQAISLTPDTGYFWFFDASNVEVILKVLDGRGLNGHVWVFYGALSNVEYTITVTDTQTGLSRQYFNPAGLLASVGDTTGFGPRGAYSRSAPSTAPPSPPALVSERTDPAATTGSCQPSPTRLCLRDGRFAVEASWKDFQGKTGQGTAVSLTGDTGYFWFFDAANVEVVLKVLDGTPLNGKHWVFYGALSNVEYTLTVIDTQTGKVKTYKNPSGRFASVADTAAF